MRLWYHPHRFTQTNNVLGDGYYAYTKSEWGSQPKEESDLFTSWIGPNPKQCLTFWYHMYGEQINTLKVFQLNDERTIELWNKSANQGNKWYFQSLSLSDIGPYRIKFKAIRGNGRKSEIAIDDIFITNTDCKKVSSLDCNFEREPYNWNVEQESEYMWTVISGGTHPNDTGPVVDHTDGFYDGNYIYLNVSKIEPGQNSNFTSVTVSSDGDACFTFWFHMYGDGMGTLNVYLVSETMTQKLWSRSGNKPDLWQLAFVDISILDPYQITLEGVRGSTKSSDIAVDDISLLPGSCNKRAFILDCNFESEKCNWLASSNMTYIWTTNKTGKSTERPDNDHTIGTVDGHYMYLEGLDIPAGMKSKLTSTIINPDGDICFTFWYHMNREEIEPYRIIFEGVRGNGYFNGIALDDISLLESSCSGLIKTSQKCHKIDESISLRECSKYYLQLNDTSLVFDREIDNCSTVYQDVQTSISTVCNDMNNSDICTFYLPELIMEDQRCFQSNWLSLEYRCEAAETTTFASESTSSDGSSAGYKKKTMEADDTTVITVSSVIISKEDDITVYAVVVSTMVIIIVAASVFIVIVCHFKKRAKSSKHFDIRPNTTVTERIDSSDYNIINYNEMTGISVLEIKKNKHDIYTTHRQPQNIKTSIGQEDKICNKYESLSTNRNSVEHTYESDSIHTNQYESLTKQPELDKHTYESTEHALPQDIKSSIEQEDNICNKYESLSINRNSVGHIYESDSIPTNQYESLTKQRELDKHTFESTEHALPISMEKELSQYQSLTTPLKVDQHVYASTGSPQ
ncbi:unnamed protein product [Mytilus coruscus]|uniref:MAM domain-containing protein n=1 Tax=Mytilus coruscus TaxID=42192 RepID=A0A6J8D2U2_MYTCO|nr:unnamed protein product [Mytilus coruscus]